MAISPEKRELEAARTAYARENPERARMLPFGNDTQYHLINAINFLVEKVNEMDEVLASHINDYEGEQVDCKWDDYPRVDTRLGEQG